MKRSMGLVVLLCLELVNSTFAQTNVNSAGNWDNSGIWSAGIPSSTSTDVTMSNNISNPGSSVPIEFPNATSYSTTSSIGNMNMGSGNFLQLESTGSPRLILGASGNPKSLTTNNNTVLKIKSGATLEIWGDLVVNNNLSFYGIGTIIIHGNLTMNTNSSLNITSGGSLTVGGNITGSSNTTISASGSGSTINVGGAIDITGGGTSSITATGGTITAGSCSCGACGSGSGCSSVLPVTLYSFSGKSAGSAVELAWSTASEVNFDYFSLQRSGDGILFNELTQVKGHGTTNEAHSYAYEDSNPIIGRSYYRLTSNDFDGYQQTFNVISIEYHGEKKFTVSPNPSDGSSVKLNFNFENDNDAQVIIYDNLGSAIGTYRVSGASAITFDNQLKGGVYLAKYSSASFTKTERFIVK